MTTRPILPYLLALTAITVGCGPDEAPPMAQTEQPPLRQRVFFLEAPCEVNVSGVGMVDVEEDYLPGVVACENGNAPTEALKAQAVMARSFLYYKLFVAGQTTLENSQSDQVYSCTGRLPNGPLQKHIDAVNATRGEYLEWENNIIASFYVAGAIPPNPDPADPWGSCESNGGSDPTSTQQWVTYNRGKTGCQIDMTNLGFTPANCRDNPYNRGCASQNGQSCLAEAGVEYPNMFTMYYGDDIVLKVAEGLCGSDPFSPQDQFCQDNGAGAACFDAATRVECADGRAIVSEACADGCGEGVCLDPPNPTFCTGQPDGSYCDGAARIECADELVSISEACPDGCAAGACTDPGAGNNQTGNNQTGNNGIGGPTNNDDGGAPNNDTGEVPDPEVPTGSSGIPPVVGVSPGVEGGCSVSAAGTGSGWLLIALLGLFTRTGRKQRRVRRSER